MKPLASAVAIAMIGLAGPAFSQETKTSAAQLETIVVTANKRIEKLENVPMAISVVNEATLQRANVREIQDLVALTPSLTVAEGSTAANNSINMRGVGTPTTTIGIESDVAIIIDDIPITMQFQAFKDLADVARIEVLGGPQSTLFGKSAVAGAINIVTKPISGPLKTTASAMMTNDGEWRVGASFGGKINDSLGVRVSASDTRYRGNLYNLTNNQWVNGSGGKTFMGKLEWHPTSNIDLELSPHYNANTSTRGTGGALSKYTITQGTQAPQQAGTGGSNTLGAGGKSLETYLNGTLALPASTTLAGITPGPSNINVRSDTKVGTESTDRGTGFKASYNFASGATLMSITSFDKYLATDANDRDLVDVNTLGVSTATSPFMSTVLTLPNTQHGSYDIRAKTQEFRLVSPDGGKLRYVVGAWFAKNETYRFLTKGSCTAPAPCQNTVLAGNGPTVPAVAINTTSPVSYLTYAYNVNKALYGQMSWDFAPGYTLTAGLRDNLETSGYWFNREFFTDVTASTVVPETATAKVQANRFVDMGEADRSYSGKLSVQKQFTKDWMGYVALATGHKGVGYNLLSTITSTTAVPAQPEDSQTMEIGVKANFLNNRMNLNAVAWDTDFFNYQQASNFFLPGDPFSYTRLDSLPRVHTRGLEIQSQARATSDLSLNIGAAYTESTVGLWRTTCLADATNVAIGTTKLGTNGSIAGKSTSCFPLFAGDITNGQQNVAGRQMPYAPKIKVSAGAQYDVPLANVPFNGFMNAQVKYQSVMTTDVTSATGGTISLPRTVVDMGFGIGEKKGFYKLSFLANNVFNQFAVTPGLSGTPAYKGIATTAPTVSAAAVSVATYTPARNAYRYFSLKLDVKY